MKAKIDNNEYEVEVSKEGIEINGVTLNWDVDNFAKDAYHIVNDNTSYRTEIVTINREAKEITLKINGKKTTVSVKDKMDLLLEELGMDMSTAAMINDVKAPMPGLIFSIAVNVGDDVKKGDPIMILEAMKMENVLKSPGDGTIKTIKVKQGDSVEKNQVLVEF